MITKPILCALGGSIGTGKTTLAYAMRSHIAAFQNCLVIEGDQVRRELLGYTLAHVMNEDDYSDEVSMRVQREKYSRIEKALEQGVSVIEASGFWSHKSQDDIRQLALDNNASFVGFWLSASRSIQEERVKKRLEERERGIELSAQKGHASDACLGVFDKCDTVIEEPISENWYGVDARGRREETLHNVLKYFE